VGALQLQQQEHSEISLENIIPRRRTNVNFSRRRATYNFLSPRWGAWEASMTAARNRSTSRSPAPFGSEPQVATGAPARSRSPPRGLSRRSCHRGGAAVSEMTRLLGHGTVPPLPPR
jgi:hypothetical protein